MQRLLKKFAKLIVIVSICSACASKGLPPRPSLWACVMIVETDSAFCINNQTGAEKEIGFSSMDKYVAFSNKDYTLILKYVKALEDELNRKSSGNNVEQHIRKELRKIIHQQQKLRAKTQQMLY